MAHGNMWRAVLAWMSLALVNSGVEGRGACLVQLQEFTQGDLEALPSNLVKKIGNVLPGAASNYRSASPDLAPSEAAVVAGDFPALIGVHRDNAAENEATEVDPVLYTTFRDAGFKVGHFGQWPFAVDAITESTDSRFISDHFSNVIDAAIAFVSEQVDNEEDYLVVLMLPRLDAAFGHGIDNVNEDNWSNGVEGPSETRWSVCPDLTRGGTYTPRYKTCPKQVYRANRIHEMNKLLDLLTLVDDSSSLTLMYSSTGGETEEADSFSRPRLSARGVRRSLYDGGLKGLFRHNMGSGTMTADITGIDLLPTLAGWAEIDVPSELPGVDASSCLSSHCSLLSRTQSLVWEWRFGTPGHCMHESPRYSILKGTFKLLHEPASESAGVEERYELYDLSRGEFELTNLWNSVPKSSADESRLEKIKNQLMLELQFWISSLPSEPTAVPHVGCYGGPAASMTNSESSPVQNWTQAELREELRGIIFILADDMAYGDVSGNLNSNRAGIDQFAYRPSTPTFDKLMSEGVHFTQYYANGCVCSPSRAAIVSGRYPSHVDVRVHNALDKTSKSNRNSGVVSYLGEGQDVDDFTLMPRFFHDQGFVTAHFGKWHLGYSAPASLDADGPLYGLDEYQLYGCSSRLDKGEVLFETASQSHSTVLNNKDPFFTSYAQDLLVNRTISFLEDRAMDERKFFVQVWLQNPHAPLVLAESYDQAAKYGFPSNTSNPWPNRGNRTMPYDFIEEYVPQQIYQTLLRDHEEAVGRLVERLGDLSLDDKTLIIHTSDNGPETRAMYFTLAGSISPFRGGKRSLYEAGVRMPMFMRWANHIPSASTFGEVASGVDLFPTLASLAGYAEEFSSLPDANRIQGRDLSCGLLRTCDPIVVAQTEPLIFEFRDNFMGDCLGFSPRFAVRNGVYKLLWEPKKVTVRKPPAKMNAYRVELYNLAEDPLESTNLLWTQPGNQTIQEIAEELYAGLRAYTTSSAYDTSKFPTKSYVKAQARADLTASGFFMDENCKATKKAWWKIKPPSVITVLGTQVSSVME